MELGGSGGVSGGGEDEFLVAASVAEDAGVAMFKRVDGGRDLELVVRNADIPTRSSFVWL